MNYNAPGKIVHFPVLKFPKLQKNPVKAMRLKLCDFHQNYQNTFMESFQFPDPLVKVILNVNHDPLQEILGFLPRFGSLKFISRNEP